MGVLGVIVRPHAGNGATLRAALTQFAGIEVALEAPDGRLVVLVEGDADAAADALAAIARCPFVATTSLVYESSADDSAVVHSTPLAQTPCKPPAVNS